jgi:DNA-binding transcriptional regulator YhcF (GntR family)
MVDLISNAGVTTHTWAARDGSTGELERGWTLFSVRECARRLGRSATTVHRVFRKLVESGHIQVVKKGRRLKHGQGTAPTIVKITRFDEFSSQSVAARYTFETSLGTKERMNKESHLQRENELSPMNDLRLDPSARHASAADDVLKCYGRWITNPRDRAAAVKAIESALSAGHSAESLIAAADRYAAAVLDRNEYHRMPPEHFFVKGYELYIGPAPDRFAAGGETR